MTRFSLALFLAFAACNTSPPLDVAPSVDLNQFQGKWYEIAHLPRPTQVSCTVTSATYTVQPNGDLSFVHECTLTDGTYHGATAVAHVVDPKAPAKLSVDFGGVMGDYWILEVASDYRYAVVGHPSRDYLWILSRTPKMDPNDLKLALDQASAKSFDTTKLEYTVQGPEASGTPAPPNSYGCSTSSSTSGGAFLGLVAVGALLVFRRKRAAS